MDIQNWPINRIMQLPDNCFGRRFLVSCTVEGGDDTEAWDISEIAIPERAVLWEFIIWSQAVTAEVKSVRVALGDQVPTSTIMMDALEPLLPSLGEQGADPRNIPMSLYQTMAIRNLRQVIRPAGRRLVLEAAGLTGKTPLVIVAVVISGIPTEVPDWLCSGRV